MRFYIRALKVLACALMLLFFVSAANAEQTAVVAGGPCGDANSNVIWSLDTNGKLTISGTGKMQDYTDPAYIPWHNDYKSNITSVEIGGDVTHIGHGAFFECSNLTNVTIQDSVTNIGSYAFGSCISLTEITIPRTVVFIDSVCFTTGSNLTIHGYAGSAANTYASANGINFVSASDAQGTIIAYGLYGEQTDNIAWAMDNTGLLTIAGAGKMADYNGTNTAPGWLSYVNSLTSVQFGKSVTNIGNAAFYNCGGLENITIPNNITSIGTFAFFGCAGLTDIYIPDSVTQIAGDAFDNCSLTIHGTVGSYAQEYANAHSINFQAEGSPDPTAAPSEAPVPTPTPGPTVVANGPCGDQGSNVTWSLDTNGKLTISGTGKMKDFANITEIPWYTAYVNVITSIEIGDKVTHIGYGAFYGCVNVHNVTIPDSVTSIEPYAFGNMQVTLHCNCTSCAVAYGNMCSIPVSVQHIGTAVAVEALAPTCEIMGHAAGTKCSVCETVLSGCEPIPATGHTVAAGSYIAPTRTSYGKTAGTHCSVCGKILSGETLIPMLQDVPVVVIPDAVIEIAEETYFNSGVECVTLPETCAKIDSKAFASCASLKLIEIPAGVTDIAGDAFEDTTDFVIVTTAGTAAETFAKQNGIDCLILHQ